MLLAVAGRLIKDGFGFPIEQIEFPVETWKSIIKGIEKGLFCLTATELQVIKLRYDFGSEIEGIRRVKLAGWEISRKLPNPVQSNFPGIVSMHFALMAGGPSRSSEAWSYCK